MTTNGEQPRRAFTWEFAVTAGCGRRCIRRGTGILVHHAHLSLQRQSHPEQLAASPVALIYAYMPSVIRTTGQSLSCPRAQMHAKRASVPSTAL